MFQAALQFAESDNSPLEELACNFSHAKPFVTVQNAAVAAIVFDGLLQKRQL
jgi:hypothetical protein